MQMQFLSYVLEKHESFDINTALNDAFDEPDVVRHTVRKEILDHKQLFYVFIFFRCLKNICTLARFENATVNSWPVFMKYRYQP